MRRTHRLLRTGRALVELLVATLLLAVGATASLSAIAQGVAEASRAADVRIARSALRDLAEALQANPCTVATGATMRRRTEVLWNVAALGPVRSATVEVRLPANALQHQSSAPLIASTSGWCG